MKSIEFPEETNAIDGVCQIRRRLVIASQCAMVTAIAAPKNLLAALDASVTIEEFIERTESDFTKLKNDDSAGGQDVYAQALANKASGIVDTPNMDLSERSWKGLDPGFFLGVRGRNRAYFVIEWRMDPFAVLPGHCHPRTSVCTLGLAGQSTCRHFDVPNDAPSYRDDFETEFQIQETKRVQIRSGSTSILTEFKHNIHHFEAGPNGAQGIDITTDYGGDGSFSFVDIDFQSAASDSEFVARWIGTDPKNLT